MLSPMTKDEYIVWKKFKGDDASKWKREDCIRADACIRTTTLNNFNNYLQGQVQAPQMLKDVTYNLVSAHFGSVEVDELLMELGMYPDWI